MKGFPYLALFLGMMIGAGLVLLWWLVSDLTGVFEPEPTRVAPQLEIYPEADLVGTHNDGKGEIWRYTYEDGPRNIICHIVDHHLRTSISCVFSP